MIFIITGFILLIIIFLYIICRDKLSLISTKLKNVEEKLNSTLIKRKALIEDSEKIIKEILNTDKDIYQNIGEINDPSINMIELDRKLLVYINEFYLVKDKYKKLDGSDDFLSIAYGINDTEDLLNAYKEYYNDIASRYNKLITMFPINILSIIQRRKKKEFFDRKSISDNDYSEFKY